MSRTVSTDGEQGRTIRRDDEPPRLSRRGSRTHDQDGVTGRLPGKTIDRKMNLRSDEEVSGYMPSVRGNVEVLFGDGYGAVTTTDRCCVCVPAFPDAVIVTVSVPVGSLIPGVPAIVADPFPWLTKVSPFGNPAAFTVGIG